LALTLENNMTVNKFLIIAIIALLSGFIVATNFDIIKVPVDNLGAGKKVEKEWEKADSPLKLKADKSKILDTQEVDDIRCDESFNCENLGKIKKYLYVSDKNIVKEKLDYQGKKYDEVRRTKNSITYKVDPPKDLLGAVEEREYFVSKFYTGDAFYEDTATEEWYQTETATTTIEAFEEQTATSTVEKIVGWLGVKRAVATSFYTTSSDGRIYRAGADATWAACRTATSGTKDDTTAGNSGPVAEDSGATYACFRYYGFVDTSSIGSGSTVSATTFYFWSFQKSDADGDSVHVVSSTANNPIQDGDFDLIGSTSWGSTSIASTITTGYSTISFNATGLSGINKTGTTQFAFINGLDLSGTTPSGANFLRIWHYERTGTANDPYLEITYSAGVAAEEPKKEDIIWFN